MEKIKGLGIFSSVALTLAATAVIALPIYSSDGTDLLAIAVATAFSATLITIGYLIITKLLCSKKAVFLTVNLVSGLLMVIFAAVTLKEFSEFTVTEVLPEAPLWSVTLLFVAVSLSLTRGGVRGLEKTAVIFLVLGGLLALLIFLFSIPKMDTKYIIPSGTTDIATISLNGIKTALRISVASLVTVPVIFEKNEGVRPVFLGSIVGGFLIFTFTLVTLLVFGGGFASTLVYPFVAAVSTAAVGDIFSGLEGFLYLLVFILSVFKMFLLFYGIKRIAANIASLKK